MTTSLQCRITIVGGALVVSALCGCREDTIVRREQSEKSRQPSTPAVIAAGRVGLQTRALCWRDDKTVRAHAIVPASVTERRDGKSKKYTTRTLWQFYCDLGARKCEGAQLELLNIDAGQPIQFSDFGPISAHLASRDGSEVHTIQWGVHSFTIDTVQKKLQYSRSTDWSEAHGEATCHSH